MTGISTGWASPTGRVGVLRDSFQQPEPLSSRAEAYKSPGDNSSPAGRTIPAGIGTASFDGHVVWWSGFKVNREKVTASFVMMFADCIFTPSFALVKLFADDRLIISKTEPTRSSKQKIRYYDGTQTTPDPLLTSILGADVATCWPGFAYAVFENFDCEDYGRRVPLIRAVLSGAASVGDGDIAPDGEILSTITFEDWSTYDPFFGNPLNAAETKVSRADYVLDRSYNLITPRLAPSVPNTYAWISVTDIRTMKEVARNALTPLPGQSWRRPDLMIALQGSGFVCIVARDGSHVTNDNTHLWLVNAFTGQIVARSAAFPYQGGVYGAPTEAILIESGARTRYLVFTEMVVSTAAVNSGLRIHLVDVTNGTIAEILTPETSGIGALDSRLVSLVAGPVSAGEVTIYFTSQDNDSFLFNGLLAAVYQAKISAAGVMSSSILYTEPSGNEPQGIAYDFSDDTLVLLREDGAFRKITLAGVSVYVTSANAAYEQFGLNVLFDVYGISCRYAASPGTAYAIDEATFNTWRIDLSDGTATLFINADDSSYMGQFGVSDVNESDGWYVEATTEDFPGQIVAVFTGTGNTLTPNVVDLVDTFTQIATFDDRFDVSDLAFAGFPGNEMYGLKLENDTTIDNLEQSVAEPFDVKIVESDGKRKYFYPLRDGSFVIGATLTIEDFVERATTILEKGMGAGEEELATCAVSYFDRDAGYKKLEQTYQRPVGVFDVTRSKKKRMLNTIMTLTASQAQRIATTTVYRSVIGNESYGFSLVPGMAHLEPGDIIQFPFGDFTAVARLTEGTLRADYTQECFADQYLQFIDATITGAEPDEVTEPDPVARDTKLLYLDLPLLSAAHDLDGTGLVQYALPYGAGETLISGTVYKSPEGFQFTSIGGRSRIAPVTGVITAISGTPADPFVQDATNTIEVQVQSGDIDRLETITAAQFAAGVNVAAIGRHGRWVVIWFETVGTPADGKVEFSDLMWGVRGSEVWIGDLIVGDLFVLLDVSEYLRFRNDVAELDDALFYKAANPLVPLGSVPTQTHIATGVAETPYAARNLEATYVAGDIELAFDYRSRVSEGLNPANHGEEELAFEIDIMDGVDVVRTIEVSASPAVWTAAQIVTDFGSVPSPFTWRVYMMSAIVGRGYVAEQESTFEVEIAGTPVTTGVNGEPYAGFTVSASLGAPPYVFTVQSGTLPSGLTLNSGTGAVTGTPDTAEIQAGIVIRVTDDIAGTDDLAPFTITITETTISGTPTSPALVDVAYSFTPMVTGGTAPYTFTLEAGTLPSGLSLNSSTGEISGTPDTIETQTGIELRATDDNGIFDDLGPFEIDIVDVSALLLENNDNLLLESGDNILLEI